MSSEGKTHPEVDDVFSLIRSQSAKWYNIGRGLKVTVNFREGLAKQADKTDDDKLETVVMKWLESHCSEPSWDYLISVLKIEELASTAEEVKKWLTNDSSAIQKYNWNSTAAAAPMKNKACAVTHPTRNYVGWDSEVHYLVDNWTDLVRHHGCQTQVYGLQPTKEHELLYREATDKNWKLWENAKHVFEYEENNVMITAAVAQDKWDDGTGGSPEKISGGVGHNNIKIKVTSENFRGFRFMFFVFGIRT